MATFLEYRIATLDGGDIVADPGEKGFIVKEEVVSARRAFKPKMSQGTWPPTTSGSITYEPSYTEVSLKSGAVVIIKRNLADFKSDMGV